MKKTKVCLFFVFLLICSSEQVIQFFRLFRGIQPSRRMIPTYFLQLSPASLVFDRKEGFIRQNNATLYFQDGSQKEFTYSEVKEDLPNFLEKILLRRTFTNFATKKMISHYFCGYHLKSLGPKPESEVDKVKLYSANDSNFSVEVKCTN